LIGYSLDSSGDIDTIDVTSRVFSGTGSEEVNFQSAKVLKVDSKSYSIDSNCVVFTYKSDMKDTGKYDTCSLKDVETGDLTGSVAVILNEDGDVVALFIEEDNATGDDYIYGVINEKKAAKDDGGDEVSKFIGYIDGNKITYKADDVYSAKAGTFDVYKIKLDADNIITEIASMGAPTAPKYEDEDESGWINAEPEKIVDLGSDKTVITVDTNGDGKASTGDAKYTVADDAFVYEYDLDDEDFTPVKLSALKDNGKFYVRLFDTKGNDADGIATIVIFYEK